MNKFAYTVYKILREQKLTFKQYIKFQDQYNVHLVGSKAKRIAQDGSSDSEFGVDKSPVSKSDVSKPAASKSDTVKVEKLSNSIKEAKKQLLPLSKQLTKLQRHRMDCANESRCSEKEHKRLDWELYTQVQEARKEYNVSHEKVSSIKADIKQMSNDMYILNKQIHGQQVPASAIDVVASPPLIENDLIVQGTDPGVITTASSVWCSSRTLFESINRYQVLQDHHDTVSPPTNEDAFADYELTSNKIDNAVLSDRRKARKKSSLKKMQKGRATRRIRLKKYHQNLVAAEAKSTATLSTTKKPKMVSFIGNWHRNSRYLRGHTTRSLKPYLSTLSTTSSVRLVDNLECLHIDFNKC